MYVLTSASLTTNMTSVFGEEDDTYTQLAGYYIAARLCMGLWDCLAAYLVPMIRGIMCAQVILYVIGVVFMIASTQLPYPHSLGFLITGLLIDLYDSVIYVGLFRYSQARETQVARRISRFFEFYPAVNIEHRVERVNAFVCLVIGYGVVGVLYQNQGYGLNAFLGKAILGLTQGYIFNWLYFEIDNGQLHTHAIRRHAWTSELIPSPHMGYLLLSSSPTPT